MGSLEELEFRIESLELEMKLLSERVLHKTEDEKLRDEDRKYYSVIPIELKNNPDAFSNYKRQFGRLHDLENQHGVNCELEPRRFYWTDLKDYSTGSVVISSSQQWREQLRNHKGHITWIDGFQK